MIEVLKLDPDRIRIHLSLLKDLFEPRFPDPKKPKSKRGAPRKWQRWLIVALGLMGAVLDFTWQEYTEQVRKIEDVLLEFGAKSAPKKTSLYNAWRSVPAGQLKSLTTQVSRLFLEPEEDSAIDSSGFLLKVGSIWRFIKYRSSELKRSSKRFFKFHIMVSTQSKTVLGLNGQNLLITISQ